MRDMNGGAVPWIETMSVTWENTHINVDEAQDLKRELAFFEQAKWSALEGAQRCKDAGVPVERPNDYFAQMVKSDEHMGKKKKRKKT